MTATQRRIRLAAGHEELRAARLGEKLTLDELAVRVRDTLRRGSLAKIAAELEAMRAAGLFSVVGSIV